MNRLQWLIGGSAAYLAGQYFGSHWYSVLFFVVGCLVGFAILELVG